MEATVLQQQDQSNNGPTANSKGRLNFGKPIGNVPNDLVTLQDSNFSKTMATAGQRPTNDTGDMALGLDQAGGLSLRAASSISTYINAIPNGTNFLERLTTSNKLFNVPVTINGHLNQTADGNLGGKCSMKANTSCSFPLSPPYPKDVICIPAPQGKLPLVAACSISANMVTITAASANSEAWGAIFVSTSR